MPKLNTENEECREYLLSIVRYWTQNFDIDGGVWMLRMKWIIISGEISER